MKKLTEDEIIMSREDDLVERLIESRKAVRRLSAELSTARANLSENPGKESRKAYELLLDKARLASNKMCEVESDLQFFADYMAARFLDQKLPKRRDD